MSIKPIIVSANSGSFEYEMVEPGQYLARCFRIVDEGTHLDVYPNSKFAAKPTHRIILYFEILQDENGDEIRMNDGRPFSVSKKYTFSLNEKAGLRKDLDVWRGVKLTKDQADAFDITKVLGQLATISVAHDVKGEKTYTSITGIMKTGKQAEGVNEISAFSVSEPDPAMFATFSEYLQKRLNESDEMKGHELPVITREERMAHREQTGEASAPAPFEATEKKGKSVSEDLDEAGF